MPLNRAQVTIEVWFRGYAAHSGPVEGVLTFVDARGRVTEECIDTHALALFVDEQGVCRARSVDVDHPAWFADRPIPTSWTEVPAPSHVTIGRTILTVRRDAAAPIAHTHRTTRSCTSRPAPSITCTSGALPSTQRELADPPTSPGHETIEAIARGLVEPDRDAHEDPPSTRRELQLTTAVFEEPTKLTDLADLAAVESLPDASAPWPLNDDAARERATRPILRPILPNFAAMPATDAYADEEPIATYGTAVMRPYVSRMIDLPPEEATRDVPQLLPVLNDPTPPEDITRQFDAAAKLPQLEAAARARVRRGPPPLPPPATMLAESGTNPVVDFRPSTPAQASDPSLRPGPAVRATKPVPRWLKLAVLALPALLAATYVIRTTRARAAARTETATQKQAVATKGTATPARAPGAAAGAAATASPHAAAGAGTAGVGTAGTVAATGTAANDDAGPTTVTRLANGVAPTRALVDEPQAERKIAEAMFAGDYGGALANGQSLAERHPEAPRYGVMVRVLRAKAARRPSSGPTGGTKTAP